jgi:hypothetical protein
MIIVKLKTQPITNSIKIIEVIASRKEAKSTIKIRVKRMSLDKIKTILVTNIMIKEELQILISNTKVKTTKRIFQIRT